MNLQEYETTEYVEMVFLAYKGFDYEMDKSNPQRVKAIFKGDLSLMTSLLEEFWANSRERKLLSIASEIKRALWVGGRYDPDYYNKRRNFNGDNHPENKQPC